MFNGSAVVGHWPSVDAATADLEATLRLHGYARVAAYDRGNSGIARIHEVGDTWWVSSALPILVSLITAGRRAFGAEAVYEEFGNCARRAETCELRVDGRVLVPAAVLAPFHSERPVDASYLLDEALRATVTGSVGVAMPADGAVRVFYEPERRLSSRDLDYALCHWMRARTVEWEQHGDSIALRCDSIDPAEGWWQSRELTTAQWRELGAAVEDDKARFAQVSVRRVSTEGSDQG
jgi:hypothetical protein